MAGAWQGKLLDIDLTTGRVGTLEPGRDSYRQYVGGVGLGARLLYDVIPPGAHALGPENVLGVLTGPITGTRFPGAGRLAFCALSPLTGGWGESSMGGFLGTALKRAGWDGVLLRGARPTPIYVLIDDDRVEWCDAGDLWGTDTYETEATLRRRHARAEIACIGVAGERQVPMAAILHRGGDVAGRCGMGAVMGAKKIKAIVVRGSGKTEVADPQGFGTLVKRQLDAIMSSPNAKALSQQGTAYSTQMVMEMGDMPVRNWSGEIWQEGADALSGPAIVEKILVKRTGCYACPIRCKGIVHVDEGSIQVAEGPGPEYETLGSLGTLLYHGNLAGVAKANELCNRLGLDTISTGSAIAWAIEAFQRGVLGLSDTDGINLEWGSTPAILQTIEAIALRQGSLGELLCAGSRRAAQQLGHGSEAYAMQVKGLDLPMHSPRVFHGLGLAYAVLPNGASHTLGGFTMRGSQDSLEDWLEATLASMRCAVVNSSAVFCNFTMGRPTLQDLADILASATGESFTGQELQVFADRVYLLRYVFNLRAGLRPTANVLPTRVVSQMQERDPRWAVDWPQVIPAFYQAIGLDPQGYPTEATLRAAGLEDLIGAVRQAR